MGGKFERAPSLGEISQTTMTLLKMEDVEPSTLYGCKMSTKLIEEGF
jgi:hypothetical protein